MAKAYDSVLVKHCKRQFDGRQFDTPGACNAADTAAIVMRTVLEMAGNTELLEDTAEAAKERQAIRASILPVLEAGAAVNFRRTALVDMGIAPKVVEGQKLATQNRPC